MSGGKGDDVLIGGAGIDTLDGGRGADTFAFTEVSDSHGARADTIVDLHDVDTIDLSAIDADTTQNGDQAFTLVQRLHGNPGELVLSVKGANTILKGDVDGDGRADFVIVIDGHHASFDNFAL